MKVTANIRRMDLVRMNFYLLPRLRANWIYFLLILIFVFAIQLFGQKAPFDAARVLAMVLGTLIVTVITFLACSILGVIFFLVAASKGSGLLGEHEFEIRSDGLFERTKANEQLNKWPGIVSIRNTGSFIYVQISSYLFHLIPRRSFDSAADFQAFHEELQTRWKSPVV